MLILGFITRASYNAPPAAISPLTFIQPLRPFSKPCPSREILQKHAVRAGIKASKKRHHLVSENELLALRVQTLPGIFRMCLLLLGVVLVASCWVAWPAAMLEWRAIEGIFGMFSIVFGIVGVRRTLSHVLAQADAGELLGAIFQLVVDAVSKIEL